MIGSGSVPLALPGGEAQVAQINKPKKPLYTDGPIIPKARVRPPHLKGGGSGLHRMAFAGGRPVAFPKP